MKTLKARLIELSKTDNIALHIIEQDYALSWIIAAIGLHPVLSKSLVFKGGTCLKKCYFGDYRFSQDLDFTVIKPIDNETLNTYIQEVCAIAKQELNKFGYGCDIIYSEYKPSQPHPHDQRAYSLSMQLPWHRNPLVPVFVEITRDEVVIIPIQEKNIIHNYDETIETTIQVYCLEEIIMEKLRAILQQIIKLHERGWGRSRARDFYDIWMIFNKYADTIDLNLIRQNINKKFQIKNVEFNSIDDFFDKRYIDELVRTWNQWLGPFVKNLPESTVVLNDVKNNILPKIYS